MSAPLAPPRPRPVWSIALDDFLHDWRLSLVSVLGVGVALAPLVILFGLKLGLVDELRESLASDPRNLELVLPGGGAARFDDAWFAEMAAHPGTGFLVPRTRGTVASVLLRNRGDRAARPLDVDLVPTAKGDPVLARAGLEAPEGDALVLTAPAAEALRVTPGDTLEMLVARTDGARREAEYLDLPVAGVLPREASVRPQAFVPVALAVAVEDYREWQRVERFGWPGRENLDDPFADFRLYARSLDDVEPLRETLAAQGLAVESAAERIARVRRIDSDLSLVFSAILALTLVGFAVTLALNQLAAVDRKRRTLAVLRLLGYSGRALMAFPLIQGAAIGLLGAGTALVLFAAMDPVLGVLFADVVAARGALTRLPAAHAGAALAGSLALAALASTVAARQVLGISPSKELRNA